MSQESRYLAKEEESLANYKGVKAWRVLVRPYLGDQHYNRFKVHKQQCELVRSINSTLLILLIT